MNLKSQTPAKSLKVALTVFVQHKYVIGGFSKVCREESAEVWAKLPQSYFGLGWMSLYTYILMMKLMFVYSIISMEDDTSLRQILKERSIDFDNNLERGMMNNLRSPTFEILKASVNLGLYEDVMNMIHRNHTRSKFEWKKVVMKKAWQMEDRFWTHQNFAFKMKNLLVKTVKHAWYLTWWFLSDICPQKINICDDLARIVCGVSKLKCVYKKLPFGSRLCELCDNFAEENIVHLTMQCSFFEETRREMFDAIDTLPGYVGDILLRDNPDLIANLLGKCHQEVDNENMTDVWCISGLFISNIYKITVKRRLMNIIQ